MTKTQFPNIADLVPHRPPMLLLDRVVAADHESLCAEVDVLSGSMFFDQTTGQVGAWVGIEYMAQAIAALEGFRSLQRGESVKIGFLLGARKYETRCAGFAAGATLRVTVRETLMHEDGLAAFECKIAHAHVDSDAGALAKATVTVFKPKDAQQFLSTSEGKA
jgi:predicted hotdog family 3-hydroxylacyl-ACP dehydratase